MMSEKTLLPRLTPFEWEILEHRLSAPDCLGDALSEEGFDEGKLNEVLDLLSSGKIDQAIEFDRAIAYAAIKDAVEGSVYFKSASSQSTQMQVAILRAGDSLAAKIGAMIGERVVFPNY